MEVQLPPRIVVHTIGKLQIDISGLGYVHIDGVLRQTMLKLQTLRLNQLIIFLCNNLLFNKKIFITNVVHFLRILKEHISIEYLSGLK